MTRGDYSDQAVTAPSKRDKVAIGMARWLIYLLTLTVLGFLLALSLWVLRLPLPESRLALLEAGGWRAALFIAQLAVFNVVIAIGGLGTLAYIGFTWGRHVR